MDLFIYCYNVFFILLYCATLTSCITTYQATGNHTFKLFSHYFLVYILESIFVALVGTILFYYTGNLKDFYQNIYDCVIELFSAIEIFLFGHIVLDLFNLQKSRLPLIASVLVCLIAWFAMMAPTSLFNTLLRPNLFSFSMLLFCGIYCYLMHQDTSCTCRERTIKLRWVILLTTIFSIFYIVENISYVFFVHEIIDEALPFYKTQIKFSDDLHSILLSILVFILAQKYREDHVSKELEATVAARLREYHSQAEERAKETANIQIESFANDFSLTDRETEILYLLLDGKSNQEISEELHITVGTVKAHVHSIFQKIGVTTRSRLMTTFLNYDPAEPCQSE